MSETSCIVIRSRTDIEQNDPFLPKLPLECIGVAILIDCKIDCILPWHSKEKR